MNRLLKIICQLSILLFITEAAECQQISVSVSNKGEWSQGGWSRIEIMISGADGCGPCRIVQYFPEGVTFRAVETAGSDIFSVDNELNIVWARMPAGKSASVVYEVMPGYELSGQQEITGRFYGVNRDKTRITAEVPSIKVDIMPGTGEMEAKERLTRQSEHDIGKQAAKEVSGIKGSNRVVFRVQILTSSSLLKEEELKERLGITFNDKVTVVPSGGLYRYQAGECSTYECAVDILERFRRAGVSGVFVTAFRGDEQISVGQARDIIRK